MIVGETSIHVQTAPGGHQGDAPAKPLTTAGNGNPYWLRTGSAFISQEERDKAASTGAAMPDGCLAGETLVRTETGDHRIDSLVGQVRLLTDEGWRDAEVRCFGTGALRAVVLRRGVQERTVFATPNHRWYLDDGRIVETDNLDSMCRVPQVGQDRRDANRLRPGDHAVTPVAQQAADDSGLMVMIDEQRRPLSARSRVATTGNRHLAAEGAPAILVRDHPVEIGVRNAVFAHEYALAAGEPPLVSDLDALGTGSCSVAGAELALGTAVAVASRKVRVGTLDAAHTADDRADVVDWLSDRAHRAEPTPSWRVVAVCATERIEQVFCAVVPELHRFVLADGILTGNSYPITTCEGDNSVDTAIHAVGRGGADHDAIRAHIIKRADSLGCASKIPDNWNDDGSLKAAVRASGAPIGENAPMTTSRDAVLSAFYADRGGLTAGAEAFTPPPPPPPAQGKAAPPTPPGDPAPPKAPSGGGDGEGSPKDAQVDAEISERIKALVTDVEALKQLQGTDPGTGKDPEDIRVDAALAAVESAAQTLAKAQDADNAVAPPSPKATPAPTPTAEEPAPAPQAAAVAETQSFVTGQPGVPAGGVPGDADDSGPGPGDIEATATCQNPECQHAGGVHEDTDDGANQGHCQTPGCNCPGMVPDGEVISNPDDSDNDGNVDGTEAVGNPTPGTTGGPIGGGPSGKGHAATGTAFADAPPAAPEADKAPAEPEAPEMTGAPEAALPPLDPEPNVTVGPQFTIPVAWVEGAPTGDGRQIAAPGTDSPGLTWRTPPLALMGLKTSPHDPSGMSGNDPAVLIGRIEAIERDGNIGKATGHLLTTDDGMEFAAILEQMGRMGVSIDVGSATVTIGIDPSGPPPEPGAMPFDQPMLEVLTEGQILGMTVCPFAAFEGAYIVLGDGSNVPDSKPPPPPPAGAEHMAINIVQEAACLPCMGEDGEQPVTASAAPGVSLLHPPKAWFADPGFKQGDPRLHATLDSKTGRPSGKFACPITVTEDGQVYGHIAQWGVCHQNPQFLAGGQCVMAPRSRMNYEAFHGTGDVITAEGDVLGVGRMTADTGHAPTTHGVSYAQAVAHYDNSGTTTALVRAGEDEFGIWVAGSLHPSATPEQVFTMRSNPPSGDWRPFGSGRELCNVLFVNTPGFPMVKMSKEASTGKVLSLVAAGVPLFEMPDGEPQSAIDPALAKALAPVFRMTQDRLTQEMDALLA